MKGIRFVVLLSLIAISACTTAHKNVSVKQVIIPGWRLGYEHLGILNAALDQRDEAREYAVHSVGDPVLTANLIAKTWRFSWKDAEYEIVESDYFTKAEIAGVDPVYYNALNYTVHSGDGSFAMELEKVDSPEGDVQFLVRPENDGVIVDLFHSGQITSKVYKQLPAQYGCSNDKLRSLTDGEEFSYCIFGVDALYVAEFRNKATRENGTLKIMSKQIHGAETEMHLNRELEVIYMSSEGLEFEKCDVDTALAER